MNNFKLLAIRPLKGCNKRFLKNLTAGQIYPLYNSYSFYNKESQLIEKQSNDEVHSINDHSNFPNSIYNQVSADAFPININISAVAGKNGSGKSTLIELFFAIVYLHSVSHNILNPNIESIQKDSNDLLIEKKKLSTIERRHNVLNKKIRKKFQDSEQDNQAFSSFQLEIADLMNQIEQLKHRKDFISKQIITNNRRIKDILTFSKELKAEVFYELNGNYYCLQFIKNSGKIPFISSIKLVQDLKNPNKKFSKIRSNNVKLAEFFFYSIAVNYSHYALNSFNIGDWIISLFHKNDGYTTPLVINPMRTEGNFDINSEMNLARYRLLTNKLQEWASNQSSKIYITENHFIYYATFTLNWNKVNSIPKHLRVREGYMIGNPREISLINTFLADYLSIIEQKKMARIDFPLKEIIVNYIINKIDSIPQKYPWFGQGYQFSRITPFIENDKFFKLLFDDGSHITYKLKQAVNFLKYNLSSLGLEKFSVKKNQIENGNIIRFTYTLDEVMEWMGHPKGNNIMTKLPPSIFDIDFELSNDIGNTSLFSGLSSGEQQLIHTIQSVVYHLNNLQSAHLGKGMRIKYQAINIVYDEIELYFHPDYQRRFIADLLKEFKRLYLNGTNSIKCINILLLTHSPFILSDIPDENILLLKLDEKTKRSKPKPTGSQTFAANINDLLADGFFLEGTLMGQFAEITIKNAIERIKKGIINESDTMLLQNVGDSFLRASLENYKKRQND